VPAGTEKYHYKCPYALFRLETTRNPITKLCIYFACKSNKPFKTHVHKGETSVPSRPSFHVLMNAVTLKTLSSMFSECVVNVFRTLLTVLSTFLTVLSTFLTVLSTFSEHLVNVSDRHRFVNVFRSFCQRFQNVLSTFSERFVNIS
jgi:hypothetical protein